MTFSLTRLCEISLSKIVWLNCLSTTNSLEVTLVKNSLGSETSDRSSSALTTARPAERRQEIAVYRVNMLLTLRAGLATPEDYNFTIYRRYQSCEILRQHLAPATRHTTPTIRDTGGYPSDSRTNSISIKISRYQDRVSRVIKTLLINISLEKDFG